MIGRRPESTVGGHEAVEDRDRRADPRRRRHRSCPIENVELSGEIVRILEPAPEGRHIRPVGEDVRTGTVLVEPGKRLGAPGARAARQRRASRTRSCIRDRA